MAQRLSLFGAVSPEQAVCGKSTSRTGASDLRLWTQRLMDGMAVQCPRCHPGLQPRSGLDPDRVEDRTHLGDVLRGRVRGLFRRDHQAGALDVEDPELLAVAGLRCSRRTRPLVRLCRWRDPALEVAVDASGEAGGRLPLPRPAGRARSIPDASRCSRRWSRPSGATSPRNGARSASAAARSSTLGPTGGSAHEWSRQPSRTRFDHGGDAHADVSIVTELAPPTHIDHPSAGTSYTTRSGVEGSRSGSMK